MKEQNLKQAKENIEDAINVIIKIEEGLSENLASRDDMKENLKYLLEKINSIENILKEESIIE